MISEGVTLTIRFRNVEGIGQLQIRDILNDILRRQLANCEPTDRIGVELGHVNLDRRVLVPFAVRDKMTADRILNIFERIQQSKQTFDFDEEMTMKIVIVKQPE
jgi:hypothetical protein